MARKSVQMLVEVLIIVVIAQLALFAVSVNACVDPSSVYAVEVVLNKPGVSYNLSPLEALVGRGVVKADNTTYIFKYGLAVKCLGAMSNASSSNLDFVATIYLAKFADEAPYVEGLTPGEIRYYLGIRIEPASPPPETYTNYSPQILTYTTTITAVAEPQILITTTVESTARNTTLNWVVVTKQPQPTIAKPATQSIEQNKTWSGSRTTETECNVYEGLGAGIKLVLEDTLRYLIRMSVISGLSEDDVKEIGSIARPGLAGWNNRLIYSQKIGAWAPYSDLVGRGLIKGAIMRGNLCGANIPQNIINVIKSMNTLTNTTLAIFYPRLTPIATRTAELLMITPTATSTYAPTPQPSTYSAPASLNTTNLPTAIPLITVREWRDGVIVAISIAIGVLTAILTYIYLSRHLLN
uniref:Uncharacterized protein n=1 Tax=Ignisphaera aggregans TaxID=334771 RepID=A0A7J2U1H4_9CREN